MDDLSAFNWVGARFECSPAKVFEQMRLEVEHDIDARNAQLGTDAEYNFGMVVAGDKFVVVVKARTGSVSHRSVTFSRQEAGISVQDNNNKLKVAATLTLNDRGECRLKVDNQEREFWQFRRMALEGLLFDTA